MLSPMTKKRWGVFFAQSRARLGLLFFGFFLLVSLSAELWSHHAPLVLRRESTDGSIRTYFPAFRNYSVEEFGIEDSFVVDYNQLLQQDKLSKKKHFALFPLNRWDPYTQTEAVLAAPSETHLLGTDHLGRDVLARLIYGLRVSVLCGLFFWLISYVIGVTIGAVQGYFGGKVDFGVERFSELVSILPTLAIVILINGLTKSQSIYTTFIVVLLFAWLGIASQMRAQFLALRRREFCEAARSMGAGHGRVIFKHILPNALTPLLTLTPFQISAGISLLAVLDYLGYGLPPPTPSLGELLSQGRTYITTAAWLLIAPTLSLIVLLLSVNMIGEAAREAFDPRK